MKRILMIKLAVIAVGIGTIFVVDGNFGTSAQTQDVPKMPETITLAPDAKLGAVAFNHIKHNGGTYSIDQTGPIECISCHHTAQPAAELAKHPPLKTPWPADRTTILTAELFAKDPKAAGVASCRDCHARAGEKPKLIAAIPEIKHEGSTTLVTMTNQQAFHRTCAGCHTEIKKTRPTVKAPTATQCTMCHKRAA